LQAAAALRLSPRPAWLSRFLAASQPKLQHLDAAQLANLAAAVAALSSSSRTNERGPKQQQQQQQQQGEHGGRVSSSWVRVWMECSKQRLVELQAEIRTQEQTATAAAAAAVADTTTAAGGEEGQPGKAPAEQSAAVNLKPDKAAVAAAVTAATAAPGVLIGQLALAAVELGVLSKPPAAAAAAGGKGSNGGVLPQSFGPTTAERLSWIATFSAAAATAAAAVKSKALDAAAASEILYALTAQQQEQPGLLQQLDAQFRQQAGSSGSNASYVLSILAAVAAAAKSSMWIGGAQVLMRLLRAMVLFGVQPGG
jgi:hypothetical protein